MKAGFLVPVAGLFACLAVGGLAVSRSASAQATAPAAASTGVVPAAASAPSVVTSPEGCVIEKFDVPSPSMKRSIHAVVVLPPEYKDNPDKRYPILYTLHGAGAPYATYSEMAPLRRALRDRPMIVTCFDGDRASMYVDSPTRPESQFETFFFKEFVPYIDAHYRTNAQRGVEGFSMGGFGAFHYMLCKPEMFCSVSSMSGAFRMGGGARRGAGPSSLPGDANANKGTSDRMDILARLEKAVKAGTKLPPMLIHCGTEDALVEGNRQLEKWFIEQNKLIAEEVAKDNSVASETDDVKKAKAQNDLLAARRINFLYMESPGAHNWPFWLGGSEIMIDFHWRCFRDAAKTGNPATK
jgi:S-formylglutathione hydrolase FrmB